MIEVKKEMVIQYERIYEKHTPNDAKQWERNIPTSILDEFRLELTTGETKLV